MVIILRGPSGIGKTTVALGLIGAHLGPARLAPIEHMFPSLLDLALNVRDSHSKDSKGAVLSADDFFSKEGEYKFDPAYLSTAHAECLRRFANCVREPGLWIVDSTNTTIAEVAPYAALAGAFDHSIQILTLYGDPRTCAARNRHGTPATNVIKQHLQLEQSIKDWPAWWPQTVVPC